MATNDKSTDIEERRKKAIAKLDEIWPFLEVMDVTTSQGEFHRTTLKVMNILEDIRNILWV